MNLRATLSILAVACSSFAFGCASEASGDGSSESASSRMMLTGNVGGGSVAAKTFGAISTSKGSLHVTAREVHARGAEGRTVDVVVAGDGSFTVGVERGRRWLLTVDDADGKSAIVTFGNGQNVLRVSADGSASRVDIGSLDLVGGEARASIAFDAKLGIEAALAGLDDVFEAANGAIIAAHEAAQQARQAAEAARDAAENARDAAEAARKAAEDARNKAGL